MTRTNTSCVFNSAPAAWPENKLYQAPPRHVTYCGLQPNPYNQIQVLISVANSVRGTWASKPKALHR